jgi:hypothetical protein
MISKKVSLSDLTPGPIRHATLPAALIERIKAYKKILGDTDPGSLDAVIDNFKRDLNPDKEVAVWERIAHVFQNFTTGHDITDGGRRREVLRALLILSTGTGPTRKRNAHPGAHRRAQA